MGSGRFHVLHTRKHLSQNIISIYAVETVFEQSTRVPGAVLVGLTLILLCAGIKAAPRRLEPKIKIKKKITEEFHNLRL